MHLMAWYFGFCRLSDMLALENDFFSSPPRKTVRFGGTVTEVLLKYKKVRGDSVKFGGFFPQIYWNVIDVLRFDFWWSEYNYSYYTKDR